MQRAPELSNRAREKGDLREPRADVLQGRKRSCEVALADDRQMSSKRSYECLAGKMSAPATSCNLRLCGGFLESTSSSSRERVIGRSRQGKANRSPSSPSSPRHGLPGTLARARGGQDFGTLPRSITAGTPHAFVLSAEPAALARQVLRNRPAAARQHRRVLRVRCPTRIHARQPRPRSLAPKPMDLAGRHTRRSSSEREGRRLGEDRLGHPRRPPGVRDDERRRPPRAQPSRWDPGQRGAARQRRVRRAAATRGPRTRRTRPQIHRDASTRPSRPLASHDASPLRVRPSYPPPPPPSLPESLDEPHPPTTEQVEITSSPVTPGISRCTAFAGTGKTTSLLQFAERIYRDHPEIDVLYCCFNTSLQREAEARFYHLPRVRCQTTGSIAFRFLRKRHGAAFEAKFDNPTHGKGKLNADAVIEQLGLQDNRYPSRKTGEPRTLKAKALGESSSLFFYISPLKQVGLAANRIIRSLERFAGTVSPRVEAWHLHRSKRDAAEVPEKDMLNWTSQLWKSISSWDDLAGPLPYCVHVKLALLDPDFRMSDFRVILFDEAQVTDFRTLLVHFH